MSVRKDKDGNWFYRRWVKLPAGGKRRIYGTPRRFSLPNNRAGAEEAERRAITESLAGEPTTPSPRGPEPRKVKQRSAAKTVEVFAPTFIALSRAKNKPRTVNSKEQILRDHIIPALGAMRLDKVSFAVIQDFTIDLVRDLDDDPPGKGLSNKTGNNILSVLRRLLVIAAKRGEIPAVPELEWLPTVKPDFDFLEFEEADRLVAAADPGEWRTMIHFDLLTGLRQGELLRLAWDGVDLDRKRIVVSESVSRGFITTPKDNETRTVELGEVATALLRAHRHLRGPLVFCDQDGKGYSAGACKHPLYRACRLAKLRRVGWHVLRHTYASHLAMLGASPSEIQHQLGHATLEMTMRYMHLSPESKRSAARLLDRPARALDRTAQNLPDSRNRDGT
jgi:integrase